MSAKNLIKRLINRRKDITPVDALTGYAHWAENYPPEAHNPLMEVEQQAMLSLLPDDLTGKRCLDLACGSGRYLRLLHQRGATQPCGTDYSPDMLAKVNEQSQNYQLSIINYQLTRAPFFPLPFKDKNFDLITCGLAVGHEENLSRIVVEMARVLQPGGTAIYSDFHPLGTLLGWQRTFTSGNGTVFSLEHYLHLYSHHQQACQAAGLVIDAVLEPFADAAAPPEAQNVPLVLVIRAVRPS